MMYELGRAEYMRVAAKTQIDEMLLTGIHHPQLEEFYVQEMRRLVFELNGYVLTSDAGEGAKDWVVADLAVRPRWFPKWAWKRMPTRRVRWELNATPKWKYPHASMVGKLGQPVEMILAEPVRYHEFRDYDGGDVRP